ncbi:MAG: SusC/RagA family TonB-linked outer membrane protein [Acidobacteriota bacterium]|nr:SusC/RagA family TonB-linked outer membrane protein [Acidobacteriota bacterium]
MRRMLYVLGFSALLTLSVTAQDLTVSGKVVMEGSGDPLPGVVALVKGTNFSTVTRGDGTFKITIKGKTQVTLVFSLPGFDPAEKTIDGSTENLVVELEESPLNIREDIVVTGFATTVKRKNLANSVAVVGAEELSRVPVQTLESAIGAKFTGVQVRANSGAPGGGMQVKLRGIATINGSSDPLYVVDGVIISNAAIQSGVNFVTAAAAAGSATPQDNPSNRIADLIPSDIESIEILKGPSAAAIYGSKASNGVVIITTKRGAAGTIKYDLNVRFGQRSLIKSLGNRIFTRETAAIFSNGAERFDAVANADGTYDLFDLEDALYGNTGSIYDMNFSARGGTEKTDFYASGSGLDDEGIILNTGYIKKGIRLNVGHRINNRLKFDITTNFVKSTSDRGLTNNENNNGVTYGVTIAQTPNFVNLAPANDIFPRNPYGNSNPLQTAALMTNREIVERTILSGRADWLIYDGSNQSLEFTAVYGYDFFSQENEGIFPSELQFEADKSTGPSGTTVQGTADSENSNIAFNLTHTYFGGENTTFTTSAGLQYEEQDATRVLVVGEGLLPLQSNINTTAVISFNDELRVLQRDEGWFIQEDIQFGENIFVSAGVRGDSSSANGDTGKFYIFPKGAFSIRLSEYDFWEPLKKTFNEFKFRMAYGQTGNLPAPGRKFRSFDVVNIGGTGGLLIDPIRGNPDIEPEESTELEIGFDAGILDDKATIEFSYYEQEIDNLIVLRELSASSGQSREALNGGEMEGDGIELAVNLYPVRSDNFDWSARVNYYTNDNTITRLDVDAFDVQGGGFARVLGVHHIEEGASATQIKGIENGAFIQLGDETPDFQISWDNYFRYKDWTLTWLLDWREGGDVINLTKLLSDLNGTTADLDTAEGQARAAAFGTTTSQLIEDGGYMKLRELKLQYTLPKDRVRGLFGNALDYVRLSLTGQNIWTETDYTSYDPEVSNFGNLAIGSIEVAPFPTSKAWYFEISTGL